MKSLEMDKELCIEFRKEFNLAMKQVEDKMGIKVSLGNISYDSTGASGKVTFGKRVEIDLLKLTDDEWIGLKFRDRTTIFTVTEKNFDDSVRLVSDRGKKYRASIDQLNTFIMVNSPSKK